MNNLPNMQLVLEMVRKSDIDKALDLLNQYVEHTPRNISSNIIVLQSRANHIKELTNLGMLSTDDRMTKRCEIVLNIIQVVDEIKLLSL